MLTSDGLRDLPPERRAELLRALIAMSDEAHVNEPRMQRGRKLALAVMVTCCVWLVPWTVGLSVTLPQQHSTSGLWAVVWVGFNVGLTLAIAGTAFAVWKHLQIAIVGQLVTGTLLLCDAWFDVTLSWGSEDFVISIFTALLAEIPLALLFFVGAYRLLQMTIRTLWIREGREGPEPRLFQLRIFADTPKKPDRT